MAISESKQHKKIRNLADLREIRTAGTKAHDLKIREYQDLDNPNNLDADSKNSLYNFSFDQKRIEKDFQIKKEETEKKVSDLKASVKAELDDLLSRASEIKIDLKELEKIQNLEEATKVYSVLKNKIDTKITLLQDYIGRRRINEVSCNNLYLDLSKAYASLAAPFIDDSSRNFYSVYCYNKCLLSQIPERKKSLLADKKLIAGALETREQLEKIYASFYSKTTDKHMNNVKEGLKNQAKVFENRCMEYFVREDKNILADEDRAHTIIFLGKKIDRLAKKSVKTYLAEAEAIISENNQETGIKTAELNHESRIFEIDRVRESERAEYDKNLVAVEPLKKNWSELDFSYDSTRLSGEICAEQDKLNEALKKVTAEIENKKAVITKNAESKRLELSVEPPTGGEDEFLQTLEKLQKDSSSIENLDSAKKEVKKLLTLVKGVKKWQKEKLVVVKANIKNHISFDSGYYNELHNVDLEGVASRKSIRSEATKIDNAIVALINEKSRSSYPTYSAAKKDLENLYELKKSIELHHRNLLDLAGEIKELNLKKVAVKFDNKLDLIYKKMDIDRLGITYGRVLNNEKLINKRYAHLARLQNKTKLIQKSYNEALEAVEKSYELEIAERTKTLENNLQILDRKIEYCKNTIDFGPEYAKVVDAINNRERRSIAKAKKLISDSEYLLSVEKEGLIRTTKGWQGKSAEARKELEASRQAYINHEFLKDAGAIRVRRFSFKYTFKRMLIRIFVIVAIFTTLGLIKLVIPNVLLGFIIGVIVAILVELAKYFLSPICYIIPRHGSLYLYNRQGELLFELTANDIVNEILVVKRSNLASLIPAFTSYQVLVESGADIFLLAVRDTSYKDILLQQTLAINAAKKKEKIETRRAEKEQEAQHQAELKTVEVDLITE